MEGEYPVFFESGRGGRVVDVDGNEYIDFLCAYGPVIIGHREREIDDSVIEQIVQKGFCFSLAQLVQNRLAAKLKELIPCAEMSLFVTTGSDATTCAIRIARSFTGKKKVIRCGYHGWHYWCVEVKGGVPAKLYSDVHEFKYNDIESLKKLLDKYGNDTAAIIITPLGHPLAGKIEEPLIGFLEEVKELAHKYEVVLVFDEIRTGFRVSLGGAQERYGITPDIAVFGKAIANGYPIGVVTGRSEIMKEVENNVFISSTFFPNSLSYIAALKTIEFIQRENVVDVIWEKGTYFMNSIREILNENKVGVELSGIPPMMFLTFQKNASKSYKEKRKEFYTHLIRNKIFLQPYHHGYICYRHTEDDLKYTIKSIKEALAQLKKKYKD